MGDGALQANLDRTPLPLVPESDGNSSFPTKRTRNDGGEAHENPWKPCQPSKDAKEWNGVEGLDGALPGVESDYPTTPLVTDGPPSRAWSAPEKRFCASRGSPLTFVGPKRVLDRYTGPCSSRWGDAVVWRSGGRRAAT